MKSSEANDLVTKGYLEEVLEEKFNQFFNRIIVYIDFKIKPLEEMSVDYYKFKDHVNKTLDWLVGAYQKFDEEYLILRKKKLN